MRPRDQSQIARQFIDDDLLIRAELNPFLAGRLPSTPICALRTTRANC